MQHAAYDDNLTYQKQCHVSNSRIPGKPWSASPQHSSSTCSRRELCTHPSCQPTSSVKALKGAQSVHHNDGLIVSSFTSGLPRKGLLWLWEEGCTEDRFPNRELRERLGVDDIVLVLQQNRLRWYGHVLQKEDDDWVKKCIVHEVEGPRPRGRPKRTWTEVVKETVKHVNWTHRMPWIVVNGGS